MTTPLCIVPISASADGSDAAASVLQYHNGKVLSAVQVFTVFWGSAWSREPLTSMATNINAYLDFILTSSLIDMLAQYGIPGQPIKHGTRTGTVTITSSEPGAGGKIQDPDIMRALTDGSLVKPSADTLYFVYLPPGVQATLAKYRTCSDDDKYGICGYHSWAPLPLSAGGGALYYAVAAFVDCGACHWSDKTFENLTKITSHELCEAITDPDGRFGWYADDLVTSDEGAEIGDICNDVTGRVGPYFVQAMWSNVTRSCTFGPPKGHPHFYTTSLDEYDRAILRRGYHSEGVACLVYVEQAPQSVPLHRLYDGGTHDHFYTVSDPEAEQAQPPYKSEDDACYVLTAAIGDANAALHRLVNGAYHLYTVSDAERDDAVQKYGYELEVDQACFVVAVDQSRATPFYRLYNPDSGDHFFTTSLTERDHAIAGDGYRSEGVACLAHPSDAAANTVPLFRLHDPGSQDHFYTVSPAERDYVIADGAYQDEGVAAYVYPAATTGAVPLHRLFNPDSGDHFYTISDQERDSAAKHGYYKEGEACYVLAPDEAGVWPFYRLVQ